MHYTSTKFRADSSSRFPTTVQTHRQTDTADHPTHVSTTAGLTVYMM